MEPYGWPGLRGGLDMGRSRISWLASGVQAKAKAEAARREAERLTERSQVGCRDHGLTNLAAALTLQ